MAGNAVNAARLTTYTSICLSLYWSDPDELKLSDVYVEIEAVPASEPTPAEAIAPAGTGDHSLPRET
jgi:hypothetical protein